MKMIAFFLCLYGACFANDADILHGKMSSGNKRYSGFLEAFKLMDERGASILVETGTARAGRESFEVDGGSTILFSNWAKKHGATLYSVDISKDHLLEAKGASLDFGHHLECICEDAVTFLQSFPLKIDFLYLDSMDFNANHPEESQAYHLQELLAALPHFTPNTIVMIDDCGLPHGGKGKLVIDYLINHGWRIAKHGYAVILVSK
jgi:hypothetical protein